MVMLPTPDLGNLSLTFGETLVSDPSDTEAVIAEVLEEAKSQEWDTNSYLMMVNADTRGAALATGVELDALPEVVSGMKNYLLEISWVCLYMEGYGTILDPYGEQTSRDEFKAFTFLSKDVRRLYSIQRSKEDEGWFLSTEGDDLFNTSSNHGRALIHVRTALGW